MTIKIKQINLREPLDHPDGIGRKPILTDCDMLLDDAGVFWVRGRKSKQVYCLTQHEVKRFVPEADEQPFVRGQGKR